MKNVCQSINCYNGHWTCGLIRQKDGIRSSSQECVYGSSRRKRREKYKSIVRDKVEEPEWKYLDVNEHSHKR